MRDVRVAFASRYVVQKPDLKMNRENHWNERRSFSLHALNPTQEHQDKKPVLFRRTSPSAGGLRVLQATLR